MLKNKLSGNRPYFQMKPPHGSFAIRKNLNCFVLSSKTGKPLPELQIFTGFDGLCFLKFVCPIFQFLRNPRIEYLIFLFFFFNFFYQSFHPAKYL